MTMGYFELMHFCKMMCAIYPCYGIEIDGNVIRFDFGKTYVMEVVDNDHEDVKKMRKVCFTGRKRNVMIPVVLEARLKGMHDAP